MILSDLINEVKLLFKGPNPDGSKFYFSEDLLHNFQEAKALELKTNRAVTNELAGSYSSAFFGSGLTFSELREYQPEDDPRFIHWPATARLGKPFVKLFKEERELKITVAIDVSLSMNFDGRYKQAVECAATLFTLARRNRDKAGLILFGDSIKLHIPPAAGRGHHRRLLTAITEPPTFSETTDYQIVLGEIRKITPKRSIIFILSDLEGLSDVKLLRNLTVNHQLNIINFAAKNKLKEISELTSLLTWELNAKSAEGKKIASLTTDSRTYKWAEDNEAERCSLTNKALASSNITVVQFQDKAFRTIEKLARSRNSQRR